MGAYRAVGDFVGLSGLVRAGAEIDLADDDAAELIADGLVEPVGGPDPLASTLTIAAALQRAVDALGRAAPDEISAFASALKAHPGIVAAMGASPEDAIAAAVRILDVGRSEASWMASGAPRVDTIEKCVGFDVTPEQRDAAWEEHLATVGKELIGG